MEPKDLKEAELSSPTSSSKFSSIILGFKKANTERHRMITKNVAKKKLGINNALKRITSGGYYGWYINCIWQPKKHPDFEKKNFGLFLVSHASRRNQWNHGISSMFFWEMYSDSELLNKPVSLHNLDIQILIT